MKLGTFDKTYHTGKGQNNKIQNISGKTLRDYVETSKELLEIVKIMEQEGGYNRESMETLQQKVSNVESAGHELQHSIEKLLQLPATLKELEHKQISMRRKVNELRQENRRLFLQSRGIIDDKVKKQRESNYEKIKDFKEEISKNEAKIRDVNIVKELRKSFEKNRANFEKATEELEFAVNKIKFDFDDKFEEVVEELESTVNKIKTENNLKVEKFDFGDKFEELKEKLKELKEKLKDKLTHFAKGTVEKLKSKINSLQSNKAPEQQVQLLRVTPYMDRDLKSGEERSVVGSHTQKYLENEIKETAQQGRIT